ncbi:MAG: zinc ribbon domain-containing protein [Promethearchaeota archaeon]|jgi:hypothetical protein
MAKFCVYCGSPVKASDKFCIICGKPLLANLPKSKESSQIEESSKEEKKEKYQKKPKEEKLEIAEEEEEEIEIIRSDEKKSKKKKEFTVSKPLPEDVKEQMVYYIEYNDIQLNKKVLLDRLKEISKSTKDSRYDYESEFKKEVNIKLEAVKTLINELKEKEVVVKKSLVEPFIVQRINSDIDTKIDQLENLRREHKLHKVDKKSFEKLREKYKQEKADLESERDDLLGGMKLWIQDLKLERTELSAERKLNKGRFHSKEISENDYKEQDKEFDLRLKKIETKIRTLEELTK